MGGVNRKKRGQEKKPQDFYAWTLNPHSGAGLSVQRGDNGDAVLLLPMGVEASFGGVVGSEESDDLLMLGVQESVLRIEPWKEPEEQQKPKRGLFSGLKSRIFRSEEGSEGRLMVRALSEDYEDEIFFESVDEEGEREKVEVGTEGVLLKDGVLEVKGRRLQIRLVARPVRKQANSELELSRNMCLVDDWGQVIPLHFKEDGGVPTNAVSIGRFVLEEYDPVVSFSLLDDMIGIETAPKGKYTVFALTRNGQLKASRERGNFEYGGTLQISLGRGAPPIVFTLWPFDAKQMVPMMGRAPGAKSASTQHKRSPAQSPPPRSALPQAPPAPAPAPAMDFPPLPSEVDYDAPTGEFPTISAVHSGVHDETYSLSPQEASGQYGYTAAELSQDAGVGMPLMERPSPPALEVEEKTQPKLAFGQEVIGTLRDQAREGWKHGDEGLEVMYQAPSQGLEDISPSQTQEVVTPEVEDDPLGSEWEWEQILEADDVPLGAGGGLGGSLGGGLGGSLGGGGLSTEGSRDNEEPGETSAHEVMPSLDYTQDIVPKPAPQDDGLDQLVEQFLEEESEEELSEGDLFEEDTVDPSMVPLEQLLFLDGTEEETTSRDGASSHEETMQPAFQSSREETTQPAFQMPGEVSQLRQELRKKKANVEPGRMDGPPFEELRRPDGSVWGVRPLEGRNPLKPLIGYLEVFDGEGKPESYVPLFVPHGGIIYIDRLSVEGVARNVEGRVLIPDEWEAQGAAMLFLSEDRNQVCLGFLRGDGVRPEVDRVLIDLARFHLGSRAMCFRQIPADLRAAHLMG